MTPRSRRLLLPVLMVLASMALPAEAASPSPSPRAVVKALYRHHFAGDMGFTPESVRSKAPWLASELLAACLAELERPQDPSEAPRINGDPFTDTQEYPRRFEVGPAWQPAPSLARVAVTLEGPRLERRVVVVLILVGDQWKVADVEDERGRSLAFLVGTGLSVVRAGQSAG